MSHRIEVGDCRATMSAMDEASIDSIVTDPPYGLSFMGMEWDHGVPGVEFWAEALRVAKPGAYLLAFGGTRTFHRLTCAIEDAGFEVQDCLSWLYGSGFPKHASRLKPAWEPIILARKPAPRATPLRIDACRLAARGEAQAQSAYRGGTPAALAPEREGGRVYEASLGRWPANVVLDEDAAQSLDEMSGQSRSRRTERPCRGALGVSAYRGSFQTNRGPRGHTDSGGASRFFYCAKASRTERDMGLDEDFPLSARPTMGSGVGGQPDQLRPNNRNVHPTVKPVTLMRWLVRLVTPPGGLVLDPFAGSGTTGVAAKREGMRFAGCEQSEQYAAIARARIAAA